MNALPQSSIIDLIWRYGDNRFGSIRLSIHSSRLQYVSLPLPEKSLGYTLVIVHHSGA